VELAAHCHGAETLYMAIEGRVYDITHYVNKHPGGVLMMTRNAGLDVTAVFNRVGHSARARAMLADMYVGDLVVTGQIDPTGALLIALWLACRLLVAVPATGSEQTRARAWKQARASVGCCVRGRERACVPSLLPAPATLVRAGMRMACLDAVPAFEYTFDVFLSVWASVSVSVGVRVRDSSTAASAIERGDFCTSRAGPSAMT
jgi:predicted heme/steroid binding protein